MSNEDKDFCRRIGQLYLKQLNNNYALTEHKIREFDIRDVHYDWNNGHPFLEITTTRPGKLIGKMGENIGFLSRSLMIHVKIKEEQDDINNYIIPVDDTVPNCY